MSRCSFCNKKCSVPFNCKSCKIDFCSKCIVLEIHECSQLEQYKILKRRLLETELNKNKTIENKRLSI